MLRIGQSCATPAAHGAEPDTEDSWDSAGAARLIAECAGPLSPLPRGMAQMVAAHRASGLVMDFGEFAG